MVLVPFYNLYSYIMEINILSIHQMFVRQQFQYNPIAALLFLFLSQINHSFTQFSDSNVVICPICLWDLDTVLWDLEK